MSELHLPSVLPPCSDRELRWIADTYDQAQRLRVQAGERIRAILQGRAGGMEGLAVEGSDPDTTLRRIRRGETDGPSKFLAEVYRLNATAEDAAQEALKDTLAHHPTWPWLSHVRGVGHTLAGRLLSRLDPARAPTPSAFWAYCGLATVPGQEYGCATCGRVMAQPVGYRVTGAHQRLNGKGPCPGVLEARRGPGEGVRVAQPRPGRGERARYDRTAKKACHLICVSFLRCRGPYADWYREVRASLEVSRPGWAKGRMHFTALRKTEKLFLAHLWIVWREALQLPVGTPHSAGRDAASPDPWAMTAAGSSTCITAAT
jgi:hypothetical protein